MAIERVQTGIPGMDELLNGGIPRGASVVLAGGAGTGKSITAMQFIYNGAVQFKEPGVFVTIQTNKQNLMWDMENFNWDLKSLQDKNLLKIERLKFTPSDNMQDQVLEQLTIIAKMVKSINAKRLVIDSISALGVWFTEKGQLRNTLFRFLDALKEIGCTTILTAETQGQMHQLGTFGVEQYVADGVIALYFVPPNRSIFIRKMRGTNHSKRIHPMDITSQGITVKAKDEIMWQSLR